MARRDALLLEEETTLLSFAIICCECFNSTNERVWCMGMQVVYRSLALRFFLG